MAGAVIGEMDGSGDSEVFSGAAVFEAKSLLYDEVKLLLVLVNGVGEVNSTGSS